MNKTIIGIVGFKNSGKDTVADFLIKHFDFKKDAFAASLKDAIASIFNWPRDMIEGETPESREWREQPDQWWSKALGIDNFTPRLALQQLGTETFRNHFHDRIWMLSVERRLMLSTDKKIVLTDNRFKNEINLIKSMGGKIIRVKRGVEPEWYEIALKYNNHMNVNPLIPLPDELRAIHSSERDWIGSNFDLVIENDGSLTDLEELVTKECQSFQ